MMDLSYQHPHPYPLYENPQWSEDLKPTFTEDNSESNRQRLSSESIPSADFSALPPSRRPSALKVEADYAPNEAMWHERAHDPHYPTRHYSHPSIPSHHPAYVRVDPNFAASYAQPPAWPLSPSGTNTPTPGYGSLDSYGQPVQYATHSTFNFNQDPISAVSMSPQSSQGGWASAASTDSAEQHFSLQSPIYRPVSPQLVLRPDGIRKKNARFEIPKERNLQTIDALILASTDESEKKELKQQKRLLRNRQAALDSRQRKKTHTEKLEQEKKVHEKRMVDLEDMCINLQETLQQEREQLQQEREQQMHQRQQYEMKIQQIIHERDEALRAKSMELADCRRQMNLLRDYVREHELDQQPHRSHAYSSTSDMNNIATDISEINFEDEWEPEFSSLIANEDMRMDEYESMHRQATPKPPAPTSTNNDEKKTEVEFSWGTFYMCLLFGAVVVSAGGQLSKLTNSTSDLSQLPKISDEYRADAENVLKAVMASDVQSAQEMIPQRPSMPASRATVTGAELSQMSAGAHQPLSTLDRLSSSLTTPTRHQQLQQAFSLTPSSYNHIVNPMDELDNDSGAEYSGSPRPSRLDEAYAAYQAKEQSLGFKTKAETRSVVSELKEFYEQAKAAEK